MEITQEQFDTLREQIRKDVRDAARAVLNPYLSRDEAVRYLDVSVETIDLYKRSGKLDPRFLGRRPFYKRTQLGGLYK